MRKGLSIMLTDSPFYRITGLFRLAAIEHEPE